MKIAFIMIGLGFLGLILNYINTDYSYNYCYPTIADLHGGGICKDGKFVKVEYFFQKENITSIDK